MVKKMENVAINKLKDFVGKEVQLNGWIYNMRSIGKIWFAIVRDGTGFVQCVVTSNDVSSEVFELESSLTQESSIQVTGIVQEDSRSDLGVEILVKDMSVIHIAEDYPIALKDHGVSFLMDNRHQHLMLKLIEMSNLISVIVIQIHMKVLGLVVLGFIFFILLL